MKKIILTTTILLALLAGTGRAGSWSIHCLNSSCESTQGGLKVLWTEDGSGQGQITGVQGLPINIDDFESAEKRIEATIEKSVSRKKSGSSDAKVTGEEFSGVGAGVTSNQDNVFNKKRSMSQSKTQGKKVSIDYTLALVKWWGDTHPEWGRGWSGNDGMGKYYKAMENLLEKYQQGSIAEVVSDFFLLRNIERVDDVSIETPINDETRDIVLIKYIGLTTRGGVEDPKERYAGAYRILRDVENNPNEAVKRAKEYKEDLEKLKILTQKNQTAEKIYEKDKDLAFAKWLADSGKFVAAIDKMAIIDKYLVAASIVRRLKENNLTQNDITFFTAERVNFEAAVKNKDQSVQIVTFKGTNILESIKKLNPIYIVAVVAGGGLVAGSFFFIKRRKRVVQ